jgi:DNA repair protein RadA/Sms
MAKTKTSYFCQNCGAQSARWIGKCPACNEWNTYVEEVVSKADDAKIPGIISTSGQRAAKPQLLTEISLSQQNRLTVYDKELSRVLGGGLVPGSLILFGGEPGIGKSTLMLQVALNMKNFKVLYVSGEESEQQIRMRAERIGINNPTCYILTETSTQNIFKQIEQLEPSLLIVDSIQTLHSAHIESSPGSVSQIRECTA